MTLHTSRPLVIAAVTGLLLPLAWSGPESTAAQATVSGAVAILRRDGTIVPFASWNGHRWSNNWPAARESLDVPVVLESVPRGWWPDRTPATRWTAWPLEGSSRPITVSAPVAIGQHCDMNVGLATDYRPDEPIPPVHVQPYPKDGLATTGALQVERIEVVSKDSAEWGRAALAVGPAAREAERRSFTDAGRRFRLDSPAPLDLEVLCRSSAPARPDASIYYVEAVRRHRVSVTRGAAGLVLTPPGVARGETRADVQPQPCEVLTIAQGWAFRDANGRWTFDLEAYVAECGRGQMVYGLPLGMLRLNNRLYWVMHMSSWGYERYEILDVDLGSVKRALSVYAGSC